MSDAGCGSTQTVRELHTSGKHVLHISKTMPYSILHEIVVLMIHSRINYCLCRASHLSHCLVWRLIAQRLSLPQTGDTARLLTLENLIITVVCHCFAAPRANEGDERADDGCAAHRHFGGYSAV